MELKAGMTVNKSRLQELQKEGYVIELSDKNGEGDALSIGTDKYNYKILMADIKKQVS